MFSFNQLVEDAEPQFQQVFIKLVGESIGIASLSDGVAQELSDHLTFRIKEIMQEATKFMEKSKRQKIMPEDIDLALKLKSIEPLYGFSTPDFTPFRYASGGGREIFFTDEKELDLDALIRGTVPKAPLDVTLKAHWLAIDGIQPAIPENPSTSTTVDDKTGSKASGGINKGSAKRQNTAEFISVKTVTSHELSAEQQLYFKEVTEACVGADESRRQQALHSLTTDTGLQSLLPRLVVFIVEGIKFNVVTHSLAVLIYLCRMIKCLLENPAVNLEKHLHELLPALLSCITSRQLCPQPEVDKHWALRDFAARVLALLCRSYHSSLTNVQTRVVNILCSITKTDGCPLTSLYGVLTTFAEFGAEVTRLMLLPLARPIGERIQQIVDGSVFVYPGDKQSADHIRQILAKCLTPAVKLELEANPQCQMDQLLGDHIWSLLLPELQQSSGGMKSFSSSSTPFNSRGPSMASSSPLPSPSVGGPQRTHSGIINTNSKPTTPTVVSSQTPMDSGFRLSNALSTDKSGQMRGDGTATLPPTGSRVVVVHPSNVRMGPVSRSISPSSTVASSPASVKDD